MPETSFVQVYECAEGRRQASHRVPIGLFMNYALERLSPVEIMQLRNDLAVLGRSRIGGTKGRWREYEMVGS
ncbi:hypothetical protein [Aureimonas leprariae]|uniref:Uncharacterized protein n=1 Tax=Plantimonas leprariae TaxID=2615207 RepID=A0A7V7PLE5_9HYPH|nr:hypothetical protein [Aureimonas leprariae]KAB0677006.1 hypothetical protein F6X38_19260 [Aureimonas leprariae]